MQTNREVLWEYLKSLGDLLKERCESYPPNVKTLNLYGQQFPPEIVTQFFWEILDQYNRIHFTNRETLKEIATNRNETLRDRAHLLGIHIATVVRYNVEIPKRMNAPVRRIVLMRLNTPRSKVAEEFNIAQRTVSSVVQRVCTQLEEKLLIVAEGGLL